MGAQRHLWWFWMDWNVQHYRQASSKRFAVCWSTLSSISVLGSSGSWMRSTSCWSRPSSLAQKLSLHGDLMHHGLQSNLDPVQLRLKMDFHFPLYYLLHIQHSIIYSVLKSRKYQSDLLLTVYKDRGNRSNCSYRFQQGWFWGFQGCAVN